jgi:hypothetical protein
MVVFGGASRMAENGQVYGDQVSRAQGSSNRYGEPLTRLSFRGPQRRKVRDLADTAILDLQTWTWLKGAPVLPKLSGGVHRMSVSGAMGGLLLTGGMHSDPGASLPAFHKDVYIMRLPHGVSARVDA